MSVTSIGDGAFSYCDSLESINIPEGVTYIGDWAFDGCSSLESITIPMSVTSIGDGAFSYCDNLIEIKAQEGSYAYKYLLNSEYSHLLDYVPSWL